jgi:uncharacterized protein (TIGR02246 family)
MHNDTRAGSTDQQSVRALYQQFMDAWNQGDGAALAAVFTDDGDLVGFDGTHLRGRVVIEEFQQKLFDKYLKGTRLTGAVNGVRFLHANTAVMHAIGGTIMKRKTKPARARESIQTLVATRTDDGWRLAAFQNTRVRPMGSVFLAFLHWSIGDTLWAPFRLRETGQDLRTARPAEVGTSGATNGQTIKKDP